jgi:hypothetical protein
VVGPMVRSCRVREGPWSERVTGGPPNRRGGSRRLRRRFVRGAVALIAILVLGLVVTQLPTIDPQFLLSGDGRPVLAGALLALLASMILLAVARMRHTATH